MKLTLSGLVLLVSFTLSAQNKIPSAEWQIKTASMAVPAEYSEGAKVYGYDSYGKFTVLREGTNQFICLADDPNKDGFQTAAYHKDLDIFMARGRELKAQGMGSQEIFDTREEEVKNGTLEMPARGTLIVFNGTLNEQTKEIENQRTRYVVYIPFATPETTGLPAKPMAKGHPWIMNPGTHRAHIMITPTYPKLNESTKQQE